MGEGPALIGREGEFQALADVLTRVSSAGTRAAFVTGEAGVGKTRLLDALCDRARREGFTVRSAKADELERDRPFGAIAAALGIRGGASKDPQQVRIAALLTGADTAEGYPARDSGARHRVTDEIVDLVDQMAAHRPVLLVIDDLQWADGETLTVLRRLGRDLVGRPLMLVGALRPTPTSRELTTVLDTLLGQGAQVVALAPLDEPHVEELVASAVGVPPGPRLVERMRAAGGNPLYVLELIAALEGEGAIERVDGRAELARDTALPSLRLTILRRLRFLHDETLQALRMAAAFGSSFSVADLAAALDKPLGIVADDLDEAVRSGVLIESGDALAFRHDLVRDAVYTDIPAAVRVALHRQAGERLAAAGAPAIQVATQLAIGAGPGDEFAIRWLRRAADDAFSTSPQTAERLLKRAVSLLPLGDAERDRLIAQRVFAMVWAGRVHEAQALANEVLSRPHTKDVGLVLRNSLARILVSLGRPADSLAFLEEALAEPDLDEVERAGLLAQYALRLGHCRLFDRGEAAAAEAARLADGRLTEAADSSARVRLAVAACDARAALSWIRRCRGELEQAAEAGWEALSIANDIHVEARGAAFAVYPLMALVPADRFGQVDELVQSMIGAERQSGGKYGMPPLHCLHAVSLYQRGDWEAAMAAAEVGLRLSDDVGMRAFNLLGHAVSALVALHRGELDAAGRAVESARAEIHPGNRSRVGLPWVELAHARVLESRGDVEQALAMLESVFEEFRELGAVAECQELLPDLARIATSAAKPALAAEVAAAARDVQDRSGTASSRAAALRCAAQLGEELPALADAQRENPRLPERAAGLAEAGELLIARGEVEEAVPLLEEASQLYEQLGATRDLAQLDSVLRRAGVRRGQRGQRRRPKSGWAALTPAELDIARLVAEGLSNPEVATRLFVSRYTVAAHLQHIFAKLGISSRSQLAAEVSRRAAARMQHSSR